MIADFSVENFYSIRTQQTLSFVPTSDKHLTDSYTVEVKPNVRLLKLGIIYGANASGKSKILNALEAFVRILITYPTSKTEKIDVVPFLLDDHSSNAPTRMQMNFYLDGEKYYLNLLFNTERILEEKLMVYSSARPAMLYERVYNPDTDSTRVEFGKHLGLSRREQEIIIGNTLNNCSVIAAFGKSNVDYSRLNLVYHWLDDSFSGLKPAIELTDFLHRELRKDKQEELKRFITQFLKKSDFNISEFFLAPDASAIIFVHETENGKTGILSEHFESSGTIRFMGIAALMKYLVKDNQFISIDEIETSLHYELLSYFLRVYIANYTGTSQLLLTTHDINLLNEDFIRRDAIWFTDKNEYAETELIRLSSLGLHKNLSPYNAYLQGKLVKLPFTGAIYLDDFAEEEQP